MIKTCWIESFDRRHSQLRCAKKPGGPMDPKGSQGIPMVTQDIQDTMFVQPFEARQDNSNRFWSQVDCEALPTFSLRSSCHGFSQNSVDYWNN